ATYAIGAANTPDAIRMQGVEAWCRQTLNFRIDVEKAGPEMAAWYVQVLAGTPRHVAAAMMTCFSAIDITEVLKDVLCPALLLAGDRSGPASVADLEGQQRAMKHAR